MAPLKVTNPWDVLLVIVGAPENELTVAVTSVATGDAAEDVFGDREIETIGDSGGGSIAASAVAAAPPTATPSLVMALATAGGGATGACGDVVGGTKSVSAAEVAGAAAIDVYVEDSSRAPVAVVSNAESATLADIADTADVEPCAAEGGVSRVGEPILLLELISLLVLLGK